VSHSWTHLSILVVDTGSAEEGIKSFTIELVEGSMPSRITDVRQQAL
jgi:hypothetical protein